jgi:proteasome assembly chaperone (PAC2) family protein
MNRLAKLYARPRLRSPVLLAAWPGISNVAIIVASYLERKLGFKRLGEIQASHFFDPIGVIVRDNVVEAPSFPQSRFSYWKNQAGGGDIMLFIGEQQPAAKGYELANSVLEVGIKFSIKRVYTFAAALTRIHHTEQPRAWAVATSREVAEDLGRYNLVQKRNLQIAGLNGLMLGVAKERDIEGVCLLGEVPMYATKIQNPMAALAILKTLAGMLDIEIDLAELNQLANETRESMKRAAAEAMGEYIDYFTEPIWEQDEEEEEEED